MSTRMPRLAVKLCYKQLTFVFSVELDHLFRKKDMLGANFYKKGSLHNLNRHTTCPIKTERIECPPVLATLDNTFRSCPSSISKQQRP